jgi:putative peptidoglycan binding protein
MRRAAIWAAALAALVALTGGSQGASTTWTHGYDVSWPQCSGSASRHLPGGSPAYAILGLTHGNGHTTNRCLPAQVSWARKHGARIGAYLVPSFPTAADLRAADSGPWGSCRGDRVCRLRTDGARQAADAVAVMRNAGLSVPMLWVDVEFRHTHSWVSADASNRHVVEGVFRGLRDAGLTYGVYTTGYMWHAIVGDWRVQVPNWLPSGSGDPAAARRMCRTTATGGRTWLGQYTREWDENLTCPAMDAVPGHRGPLWRYRNTTLRIGSAGPAVKALQEALKVSASGSYELQTVAAVTEFQQAHGLPVNGQVDSDDWRALGAWRMVGGRPWLLTRMTTR